MELNQNKLLELAKLAIDAAKAAGTIISNCDRTSLQINQKNGGSSIASQVVTEIDVQSEKAIVHILEPSLDKYNIALLTEESTDDKSRLEKDFFWCIDPLDGTLSFIESRPGYSVSIALVKKDGTPYIGVIFNPTTNTLYHAIKGIGAYKNQLQWFDTTEQHKPTPLTLFCDKSFLQYEAYSDIIQKLTAIAIKLGYSHLHTIAHGGAAMNACWVIEQAPACYFKLPQTKNGGGSLWDFAASTCIYNELRAHVTDIHGNTLDLNRADSTFMNKDGVLYASNSYIAKQVIELCATL